MGAAAFDLGARRICFADRSRAATTLAGELLRAAGGSPELRFWDPLQGGTAPAGTFDLILLGHVLNELWPGHPDRIRLRADVTAKLRDRLRPGGRVLIVEPALTVTAREALEVRDLLVASGFRVLAPCLWQQACPALAQAGASCHREFAWTPPRLLQDLVRRAGFRKKTLKATAFLLQASALAGGSADPGDFRVVSEPLLSKNRRVRLIACGPAGRIRLALKPETATSDTRAFLTLARGDLIRVHGARARPGGLDLVPGSRLTVLRRGGAVPFPQRP